MACECRRIVTDHTPEGESTVPPLEADSPAGARQEDRAGAASPSSGPRGAWSTTTIPLTLRCGRLALPTGTAWRDQPP